VVHGAIGGRIKGNGVEAGAAVLAGVVEQLRAENPNTVFATAGDLIGASTFESFIAHDKPTIDVLNAAGLQVSAVGNHEFDQGYSDLVNRVMAPYDATTNPYGGATWKYLGANVRDTATGNPALPETWTIDLSGIKVGFVGVITHHLPELVSPTGIAGLTIEPEVTAANRSAAALKAAGADIVVMLVHEGAATTASDSAVDPASDFGKIVLGAMLTAGQQLSFNLTSLVMSAPADLRDSAVKVSLGHKVLGTFPVDATLGTAINDEYGTASVAVPLPKAPEGSQVLTITGGTTGTEVSIPVTIAKAPKPHPSPGPKPHLGPHPGPTPGHGWWWGAGSWSPSVAWWTPPPAFWTHDGLAA
jgi:hypothetical protein